MWPDFGVPGALARRLSLARKPAKFCPPTKNCPFRKSPDVKTRASTLERRSQSRICSKIRDALETSPLTFSERSCFFQGCYCRRQRGDALRRLFIWLYHTRTDILENQTLLLARVRFMRAPLVAFWCGFSKNSWPGLFYESVKSCR